MMIPTSTRNGWRHLAAMIALAICVLASPAQAQDEDFKKEPGYVDFDALKLFEGMEASVEVFLKGALLEMAIQTIAYEEPDLADALMGIKLVRVHVFQDYDFDRDEKFRAKADEISKSLEKKGWEMAVRVRDRDQQVLVYVLPGKNKDLEGLVVMAVEDRDEAVFLNIVGKINPADIGRLGSTFRIDLDDYEWDLDHSRRRSRR